MEEKKTTTAKATEKKTSTKAAPKTEAKKETKAPAKAEKEVKEVAKTEETKTAKVEKAVKDTKPETKVTEASATLRYARISARKVKIVADNIKGKQVDEALAILKYTPKASSEILEKLLKSAIANAENNFGMTHSKLYIADIYANQGPTLRRIRPAAKGSAFRIRKRTSHTTIVLKERD